MTALVRASGLRGFRELTGSLGGDGPALLRAQHIDPDALDDEDALIPLRAVAHVLAHSAQQLACPDFALRLAQRQDISILGPLAVAMQNADTLGDALRCASRYLYFQSPGISLSVIEDCDQDPTWAEIRYAILLPRLAVGQQLLELGLAIAARVMKLLSGGRQLVTAVHWPHLPAAALALHAEYFAAPVQVQQPYARLLVAPQSLDIPVRDHHPALRQMALDYLGGQFPQAGRTLEARVRQVVARSLGTGHCTKQRVADALAMHPRTLQRHLAAEGSGFESVLDGVRREAAHRYLTTTDMSMSQITGLLGFAEQAVFSRACRRWFACSPRSLRQARTDPPTNG